MSKGFSDMIQTYAQGTFILVLGKMASALISAIGVILIARFLGPTRFGILSIAQIPVSIALIFITNGVASSIITFTAEQRHRGEDQTIASRVVDRRSRTLRPRRH